MQEEIVRWWLDDRQAPQVALQGSATNDCNKQPLIGQKTSYTNLRNIVKQRQARNFGVGALRRL